MILQTVMKRFRFMAMMLMACIPLAFCSCSDDDDDNGGGNGSGSTITVGGNNVSFNTFYWTANDEDATVSGGEHFYQIEFYTFDLYKAYTGGGSIPGMFSLMYVSFVTEGSLDRLPTGTFEYGEYEMSGVINATVNDGEGENYIEEGEGSGHLIITEKDGKYTVSIDPLNIEDGNSGAIYPSSFLFTGTPKKVPAGIGE